MAHQLYFEFPETEVQMEILSTIRKDRLIFENDRISGNLKDIHTRLSLDVDAGYEAGTDIKLYLCERFAQLQDDFDNRTSGGSRIQIGLGDEIIDGLVRNLRVNLFTQQRFIRYVESTRHRPDHHLTSYSVFDHTADAVHLPHCLHYIMMSAPNLI
ncbi:hypothetical protein D9613_011941 [Agrocybe pediades]|uniref:Uncharacterized protein n=1 Tax=Agrocybe pediades TaxID=84607 RepID=A0A8H4QFB3_9AGAR|nr:hypothetical protein D9613_011941 [Agrocybe pediades]